jgi:hypothetical protein
MVDSSTPDRGINQEHMHSYITSGFLQAQLYCNAASTCPTLH